jgi:hypothetical protein
LELLLEHRVQQRQRESLGLAADLQRRAVLGVLGLEVLPAVEVLLERESFGEVVEKGLEVSELPEVRGGGGGQRQAEEQEAEGAKGLPN